MRKVKVGIAGLGRLGKVHARNLAFKIPNAELTAACSIILAELEYAREELGVADVYEDYREMLAQADIDAVAIVTTSGEHCWQIAAALVEGAIRFAATSGGIFIDMAIHDIDLMRWFLGSDPAEVYAAGATFKHPEFVEAGDDETGAAMYKCANGALGIIHVGRTAAHGYHIETEIIGTEGALRISPVPEKNLCMIYDKNGAVTECVSGFPERFAEAYLLEMQEFVDCVADGKKPEVTVYDGTKSTQIGFATTQAWKTGNIVKIQYN